jgi:hypothetical protein
MLLLDDPDCPYCGKHLLWGGIGWRPHTDDYHAYWYRYWLRRLAIAMEKLDVWGQHENIR